MLSKSLLYFIVVGYSLLKMPKMAIYVRDFGIRSNIRQNLKNKYLEDARFSIHNNIQHYLNQFNS